MSPSRGRVKTGPRLGGNADGDDPLGLDVASNASPRTRMRAKRDRRDTAGDETVAGTQLSEADFDPARFLVIKGHDVSDEDGAETTDALIHAGSPQNARPSWGGTVQVARAL